MLEYITSIPNDCYRYHSKQLSIFDEHGTSLSIKSTHYSTWTNFSVINDLRLDGKTPLQVTSNDYFNVVLTTEGVVNGIEELVVKIVGSKSCVYAITAEGNVYQRTTGANFVKLHLPLNIKDLVVTGKHVFLITVDDEFYHCDAMGDNCRWLCTTFKSIVYYYNSIYICVASNTWYKWCESYKDRIGSLIPLHCNITEMMISDNRICAVVGGVKYIY